MGGPVDWADNEGRLIGDDIPPIEMFCSSSLDDSAVGEITSTANRQAVAIFTIP
jgi:hypothetical protein